MYITLITAGVIAFFATYNLIFHVLLIPQTTEEYLRDPIVGWYLVLIPLFAGAFTIRSNHDFFAHFNLWKEHTDEKISNIERGIKPDVCYSANYAEKMKETKSDSIPQEKIIDVHWGLFYLEVESLL